MKVVILACVFVAVADVSRSAAIPPSEHEVAPATSSQEHVREKRSSYGSQPYGSPAYGAQYAVSPCGASAPIALGPATGYHLNVAPVHHQAYQQQNYGYIPQYRTDMADEQEMMSFSDMDPHTSEHMPMARYGYGAQVAAPHYGGAGVGGLVGLGSLAGVGHLSTQAAGPAYGIFPGVSTGGCNVPLLLSCSPSISAGKIVKTHPQGYYAAAAAPNAYRGVDEQSHVEHEHHEEATHEQLPTAHEASHQ